MSRNKAKIQQYQNIFIWGGAVTLLIAYVVSSLSSLHPFNSIGMIFVHEALQLSGGASLAIGGFLLKDKFLKIFGITWFLIALFNIVNTYNTLLQFTR